MDLLIITIPFDVQVPFDPAGPDMAAVRAPVDALAGPLDSAGHGPFEGMSVESDEGRISAVVLSWQARDPDAAFSLAQSILEQNDLARTCTLSIETDVMPDRAEGFEPEPGGKSIEVYYDIDAIPEGYDNPLDFRNAAMAMMDAALEEAEAGEWTGAEIGAGEVNFGFEVSDFDRAEEIVRAAVRGTAFDCIREIRRQGGDDPA